MQTTATPENIYYLLTLISGLLLPYLFFSNVLIARAFISPMEWYFTIGVVIRQVYNLLGNSEVFRNNDELMLWTEEITRNVIALQLISTALHLPKGFFADYWRPLVFLIFFVMPCTWMYSWLMVYLFYGNTFTKWLPFAIATCFAPTDPVIITSILKGKFAEQRIPARLRYILLGESGFKDGFGYPLIYICIFLLTNKSFGEWFTIYVLYHLVLAMAIGIILGYIFGNLINAARRYEWIDFDSLWFIIFPIAVFSTSLVNIFGGDGIIAVFLCGIVIQEVDQDPQVAIEQRTSETLDIFAIIVFAIYLGFIMPWNAFEQFGVGRLFGLTIVLLLTRRVLFIVPFTNVVFYKLHHVPGGDPYFIYTIGLSIFSPVATAALLYSTKIYHATKLMEPFYFVTFVAFVSIFFHGTLSIIYGYLVVWIKKVRHMHEENSYRHHQFRQQQTNGDIPKQSSPPPAIPINNTIPL